MTGIVNVSRTKISRRAFLGTSSAAVGSLVLGFALPAGSKSNAASTGSNTLNAFIAISSDGIVTIQCPFIEMGQGTYTSIPMLIAEELDVEMSAIRVEQAPHGPEYRFMYAQAVRFDEPLDKDELEKRYGEAIRFTGGSSSVRTGWRPLREAGATARALLVSAAAEKWQVSPAELETEPGFVLEPRSKRRLAYGELVRAASGLPVPRRVTLKDKGSFRILGKPLDRTDVVEKTNGQAQFGIDFKADGVLTAAVAQSPVFGGEARHFDAKAAVELPGVISVDRIPNGVAVVADSYWHAKKGLDAVASTFSGGAYPEFSDDEYLGMLRERLGDEGVAAENKGDVGSAFAGAAKTVSAEYHTPFLAHATMEPMNSAALVEDDRCVVWTPNQGVDFVAETAAAVTGLPLSAIEVKTPYLGGGFGRRYNDDFVVQAVTLAKLHKGIPIKVIWSREEDLQHDFYRPMTAARYRAAFDGKGRPTAVHITTVGDGPSRRHVSQWMEDPNLDDSVVEGTFDQPYSIPNWRSDYVFEYAPPPIGFWRSVGNSHNAFFKESFIDEMAHAVDRDPVEFRLDCLSDQPRFSRVLETVSRNAGWRNGVWKAEAGENRAMGVALHHCFGSIIAQIAEVSIDRSGSPRVHKVWAALDCGFAMNPKIVVMQIESGIAFGLSAALKEKVSFANGRAVNGNFHDYPILTPQQMPDVELEIINSGAPVGGIGEVGTPPIAPAVCNAIFSLTGRRIRSLPIASHTLV